MKILSVCVVLCTTAFIGAARGSDHGAAGNTAGTARVSQSQQQSSGGSQQTIEKVPLEHTSANSGRQMYASYCAACHGKDGKGNGPAASALKEPPPDLTLLAKNNNGKFPADRVAHVLQFGMDVPAHGSKEMPTWGPLFSSLHGKTSGSAGLVQLRITNLTNYIKSLQAK